MARKFTYPISLTQLAIVVAALMCAVPQCSADTTTTAAASPENLPAPSAESMAPVGSTVPASIAASPATVTAPEKFALPNPADLGFGGGYGGQTVPGGGLGGFNGYNEGFGGCCGGFGYNGFGGNGGIGYDNGPLFFGSAPATRLSLRSMAVENGFAPLLMAGVVAMFYV
ncbi:unnamed protein product [Alopecurus aequalis]